MPPPRPAGAFALCWWAVAALVGCSRALLLRDVQAESSGNDGSAPLYMFSDRSGPEPALDRNDKSALVVSADGMNSHFGSGVRQMAFITDLQDCGFHVDTLTDQDWRHPDWSTPYAKEVLAISSNYHIADGHNQVMKESEILSLMQKYSRIYFFGWAWELEYRLTPAVVLRVLEMNRSLQSKVTLVVDDVPHMRCYGPHDLAFCRQSAPATLTRWLQASSHAFAINRADADNLNQFKATNGIHGPDFQVWPMFLQKLQRLFETNSVSKVPFSGKVHRYITMIANDHAENKRFMDEMIEHDVFGQVCSKTRNLTSKAKQPKAYADTMPVFLFAGRIGNYLESLNSGWLRKLQKWKCLEIMKDVTMAQLAHFILPRSRAIFNPFSHNLGSGISVKTFEAVAMRFPIVTSLESFRGLEQCGSRLSNASLLAPKDPDSFAQFVTDSLLTEEDASKFRLSQYKVMDSCVQDEISTLRLPCVA